MPNLNELTSKTWNQALFLLGNDEAQKSFLAGLDRDQNGQVTGAEFIWAFDQNKDGYLTAGEMAQLAIKAEAHDYDQQTIRAISGALASAQSHLPLFALDEAQGEWQDTQILKKERKQYTTVLPHASEALASRDLKQVAQAKAGYFQVQSQVGNSCGTTSLSMILKYFQGHTLENSVPTIDKYIRAKGKLQFALPTGQIKSVDIDGYTAPRDIVNYAQGQGMRAGMKNQAKISDLKKMLDQGVPCLCLTDWNFKSGYSEPSDAAPDANSLHWVNVIGYEYDRERKLQLIVANPWGLVQKVSEADFEKVWTGSGPGLEQEAPGIGKINTGIQRLFIAMVPKDEAFEIVAPDGTRTRAGNISIPSGHDGIRGKLAKWGSDALQFASEFQDDLANRGSQLIDEARQGYAEDGVWGMLRNLWEGDATQAENLKKMALKRPIAQRAAIINDLLNKGINREAIQTAIYAILKETSWVDFPALIDLIDTQQLAKKLDNDTQAGNVLAWIAKIEVERRGKTGPKFETFAAHLAAEHRNKALDVFLENTYTQAGKLLHKVPAATVREWIQKLLSGVTDSAEETTIYKLFKASAWEQFDQIMARLDMQVVASELEDSDQLANLMAWAVESAYATGRWGNLSEMLSHLESLTEYTRADNVVGSALNRAAVKGKLHQVPGHLRNRLIDLLDDRTRWRTDDALAALNALKAL